MQNDLAERQRHGTATVGEWQLHKANRSLTVVGLTRISIVSPSAANDLSGFIRHTLFTPSRQRVGVHALDVVADIHLA